MFIMIRAKIFWEILFLKEFDLLLSMWYHLIMGIKLLRTLFKAKNNMFFLDKAKGRYTLSVRMNDVILILSYDVKVGVTFLNREGTLFKADVFSFDKNFICVS